MILADALFSQIFHEKWLLSIQVNLIYRCSVRMWAIIPLAKDVAFSCALWYGKCLRFLHH